jgi:hypothetical protein
MTLFAAVCTAEICTSWAAAAQFNEIQSNVFDGMSEVAYVGGVFSLDLRDESRATSSQVLTLFEDNLPIPGFTGNVRLRLTSNFFDYGQTLQSPPRACLGGGSFSLTFDYSPDGISVSSYELSGPVRVASLEVTTATPGLSYLTSIVAFDEEAGVRSLPGSNNWLTPYLTRGVVMFFAGGDLSAYQTAEGWSQDMPQLNPVTFESVFSIIPDEGPLSGEPPSYPACPEPAVLAMFAVGGCVLMRGPYRLRA